MYYRNKISKNWAGYIESDKRHMLFGFVIIPTISIIVNIKYVQIEFIFGFKKLTITFIKLKEKSMN